MTVTVDAQPLEGGIGIELDLDLTRDMTVNEQQAIIDLFLQHHLLLIRQFIRQMAVEYEFQVSFGKGARRNGTH